MENRTIPVSSVRVDKNLKNMALVEIADTVSVRKSPRGIRNVWGSEMDGVCYVKVVPGRFSSVKEFSVSDASGTEIPVSKEEDDIFTFPKTEGQSYFLRITSVSWLFLLLFLLMVFLAITVWVGYLCFFGERVGPTGTNTAGIVTALARGAEGTFSPLRSIFPALLRTGV